ncbi:hypothetical protein MG293_000582 [Ovis ammon polii]|uniref:Uncharacterized protein n=1 Tax=Ovis ammon polii TaxID=230172 RepID=A0AAD4UKK2_OVIAM|nr:hypothetical protein MG293_000582 [Ovis ammon polii]
MEENGLRNWSYLVKSLSSPGSSDCKESACNSGDPGSIPESGRSPGEENGYPLQYSYLENYMDRGAWQAMVYGATKSWTQLSKKHSKQPAAAAKSLQSCPTLCDPIDGSLPGSPVPGIL